MVITITLLSLAACTNGDPTDPGSAANGQDEPVETLAPEQARDELADSGISEADLECAQNRLDLAAPIDEAVIDRLEQQCAAVRTFADNLAQNLNAINDDQRGCLTAQLIALPPDALAGLYANALRPDDTLANQHDQLAAILQTCGIKP